MENYDDDQEDSDYCQSPIEYQSEVESIESFNKSLKDRYNACPTFFLGSLQEACESALNTSNIKERRPILVYIHHEKSSLNNTFCSNIFCADMIIKYLSDNYIIWACDITFESNRNKLMKVWKEIFPIPLISIYIVQRCPLLIGILRRSEVESIVPMNWNYEFKSLLEGDTLMDSQKKLNCETLLQELVSFKQEFDKNQHTLIFDLITKDLLHWDAILEITDYLSFNDAITTFSLEILPSLLKYKTKLHLSDPSDVFIKWIIQKIKPEQIASLSLKTNRFRWLMDLSSLAIFSEVISLTLINLCYEEDINKYKQYFSKVNLLSLYYDVDVSFRLLLDIVLQLWTPINQLKIRLSRVLCNGTIKDSFETKHNTTIEYFYLDITEVIFGSIGNSSYFLREAITELIKDMRNIRYVRFTINKYDFEQLLVVSRWERVIRRCHQLKKIIFQINEDISQDNDLAKKVLEIQNALYEIRNTIKFKAIFL